MVAPLLWYQRQREISGETVFTRQFFVFLKQEGPITDKVKLSDRQEEVEITNNRTYRDMEIKERKGCR
jgi:hypothetical protein